MKLCDVSVPAAGRFYQRGHESAKGEGLNTIEIMAPNRGMKRRPFARIAYDVKLISGILYGTIILLIQRKMKKDRM